MQYSSFVRLTELIPHLFDMVNKGELPVNVAVELSYLSEDQQHELQEIIEGKKLIPSLTQARRLKTRSTNGLLDYSAMYKIMTEDDPKNCTVVVISRKTHDILSEIPKDEREDYVVSAVIFCENLKEYFPKTMPLAQMKKENIKLVKEYFKNQPEK